jgi:DNA-binding transcriptional regulator YiaG
MTYEQLLKHFGSQADIARAFGITQASVAEWQERGVPPLRQIQGEMLTNKKLRADPDVFSKQSARA